MRRLRLGEGDAAAIKQLFKRLQQVDRDFYYLFDLDDDSRLRNVMWIHPRSRAAYEDFHDVVSFDTTYLVNQYDMPFASVVGVNHHNQSILLGCALLSNEKCESFKWFFRNWLDAMGGLYPNAILTDQDDSIKNALSEIMPDSIHRLCIWHIVSKTSKKLQGVADLTAAKADFKSMVYECTSIDEFESCWPVFQAKHGLQNNRWLRDLWTVRKSWVPVYSNHTFWAGMSSTQRSESMHAFFDHYINYRSTLKTFVEQYEIAVTEKFRKELSAEFASKSRPVLCMSPFKWEGQFAREYTNNIMVIFQDEIKKIWNCNSNFIENVGGEVERYNVTEAARLTSWYSKERDFIVEYRPTGGYINCKCKKFESKGILCCHILKVLVSRNIDYVNERYVHRRWSKLVYRPHFNVSFAGGYPVMTDEYKRYQELEKEFRFFCDFAVASKEKTEFVKGKLKELASILPSWTPPKIVQVDGDEPTIKDPYKQTRKGRPNQLRLKSAIEKKTNRGRKGSSNMGRQLRYVAGSSSQWSVMN